MKTLLAISSSPRLNGNSDLLMDSFIRGAEEEGWKVNRIRANNLKINCCQACDHCSVDGECIQKDEMQDVYPQIASADAIVLAAPIFFGSMAAQLKIFIDRFQCWWHAKYNLNTPKVNLEEGRPGFFICVGALKTESYCKSALAIARVFFHNINFKYKDSFFFRGVDKKGEIKEHPEALQGAYEAGRKFVREAAEKNS